MRQIFAAIAQSGTLNKAHRQQPPRGSGKGRKNRPENRDFDLERAMH